LNGIALGNNDPLPGARVTTIELRVPGAFESDDQFAAYVAAFVKHFEQKGWADRLFLYLWDEPQPGDLPKVAARGRAALSAAPNLRTLLTMSLNPAVRDVVKIWVPLVNCLTPRPGFDEFCSAPVPLSSYAPELAAGKSLWFYQSCASHGCSGHGGSYFKGWPSYMIDSSGPANRVMQWIAWKLHIEGELYYSMTEDYSKK